MSSPILLEPGVFGIRKPVLLLPEGIIDHLPPPQLEAIIAHEMCHVRRRDNLTATIHLVVETIFWFHPLVWWIRTRLVDERERACDTEVLRVLAKPEVYAEGILNVCRLYLASPLISLPGITGSNLEKRIEEIMLNRAPHNLGFGKKLLVGSAIMAALAIPFLIGIVAAPGVHAQAEVPNDLAFETASIKPNPDSTGYGKIQGFPGGRWKATGASLRRLVSYSNQILCCPPPSWKLTAAKGLDAILDEHYDIEAKAEQGAIRRTNYNDQMRPMVRALLADRFKLVIQHVTKEGPVFALVSARNGPKFKHSKIDCENAEGDAATTCGTMSFQPGTTWRLSGKAIGMAPLVGLFQGFSDRPIIDKTGLRGLFEIAVEVVQPESAFDATRSIIESLGLKLESQNGHVETLVIEHVERPSEN